MMVSVIIGFDYKVSKGRDYPVKLSKEVARKVAALKKKERKEVDA